MPFNKKDAFIRQYRQFKRLIQIFGKDYLLKAVFLGCLSKQAACKQTNGEVKR